MQSRVEGEWTGWDGNTIVRLENGTVWRQEEYFYFYNYQYRPIVVIDGNVMHVAGSPKSVRVRQID